MDNFRRIISQYLNAFVLADSLSQCDEIMKSLESLPDALKINFNELSMSDLFGLGFTWDEESGLMVMPTFMFFFCQAGMELFSIIGGKYIAGEIDLNPGCIVFGVVPRFE